MFEIFLLSLVGWAAVGGVIYEIAKDDDDSDGNTPPEHTGEVIEIPEGGAAEGSDGDDTITGAYATGARGNGGDDVIRLDILDGGTATGGPGDDLVEVSNGYDATIKGGLGDDTLTGGRGDRMTVDAGPGDDLLQFDLTSAYFEGYWLDGGEGDDIFELTLHYEDNYTQLAPVVTGGDGADSYDLALAPVTTWAPPEDDVQYDNQAHILTITDFTPGEDMLSVTLPLASDDNYLGAEIQEDATGTNLVLLYQQIDEAGGSVEARAMIALPGATGVTLADILIETETAAAA